MRAITDTDRRILNAIEPVANDIGYHVVRVRVTGGKSPKIQIMAERESDGLMNVDDCADLSRAVSTLLGVEYPVHEAYVLEISSPGLDRPLTRLADFESCVGYQARLELGRFIDGRKRFCGELAGTDGENIHINLDDEDDTARIPFEWISEAKLLITDEMIKAGPRGSHPIKKAE
ncbi:MAG: ribosome maturation factor RimP [Hyphomonadaceae bacterium]|nr:ribosome maturation factor RimP [Hyphomonadaceae bacterium]